MKIIAHGNMKTFKKNFDLINKRGTHFFVKINGMSKKIQYPGSDYGAQYMDSDFRIKGVFLCGMVKSNIKNYIKSKGTPEILNTSHNVVCFNDDLIKKNIGIEVSCIDINYCYWQTAYNMGFITKKTFERGIESESLKDGRLAAIGSLNKLELIEEYKDGKKVGPGKLDEETNKIYSPFYHAIINRVSEIMMEALQQFPGSIFMWLTDCAYILPEYEQEFMKFLDKKKYKHKQFKAMFTDIDEKACVVSWFTNKPKEKDEKRMSYNGRTIDF